MDPQTQETMINPYLEGTAASINLAECKRLFVGDLRPATKIQHLFKYFIRFGAIENVYIARNFEDGICKGYGFVVFQDELSLDIAMSFDNHVILDWPVRIKKGHPRVEVIGMLDSLSSDEIKRYFSHFGKVVKVGAPREDKNNDLEQVCAVTFHLDEVVQSLSTQHIINGVPVRLKVFTPKESASLKIFGKAPKKNAGSSLGYEDVYSNVRDSNGLANSNNLADLSVYNSFQNFLENKVPYNNRKKAVACENCLNCQNKDKVADFNRLMCNSTQNVSYSNVDGFNVSPLVENVNIYDPLAYNNLENLLTYGNAERANAYSLTFQNNTNLQELDGLSYNNSHGNIENAYSSLWYSDVDTTSTWLGYPNTVNYSTGYDRLNYDNLNAAQTCFLSYENVGYNGSAYTATNNSVAYKNLENLLTYSDGSYNSAANSEGCNDLLYKRLENLCISDDFPCHSLGNSSVPRKVPFSDAGDFYGYNNFVYDTLQNFSTSDNLSNDNPSHTFLNGHVDPKGSTYSSYGEFSSASSESSYSYDSLLANTAQNVSPYGSIASSNEENFGTQFYGENIGLEQLARIVGYDGKTYSHQNWS